MRGFWWDKLRRENGRNGGVNGPIICRDAHFRLIVPEISEEFPRGESTTAPWPLDDISIPEFALPRTPAKTGKSGEMVRGRSPGDCGADGFCPDRSDSSVPRTGHPDSLRA